MPSPRELVLDTGRLALFECGASLLALLAFPSATDEERAEIEASLCANHLRAVFEETGDGDKPVKAKYAFRDLQVINSDLRTFDRLIRDRIVAARVAIPFLQRASGHGLKLPSSVKRLSINQLAEFVMKEANQSNPENFKTRVWRPSLPVIHLAAAVVVAMNDRRGMVSYGNLIADQSFIGVVLTYTSEFENIIKNNNLRGINSKRLVSVQLAP
jgi:hypothetical protein